MKSFLIASVLVLTSSAFAQAPAAPATPPPAPQMTPEGKKLIEGMVGNWNLKDAKFVMGDKEFKGKVSMKCDKELKGWATLCKGKFDLGKEMQAEGIYVFAWDITTNEGHMLEVENTPTVHNHVGKWTDDKTIQLSHSGKNAEGKDETDTVTIAWVSPKEATFHAVGKSGATTNWTFTGTMKK